MQIIENDVPSGDQAGIADGIVSLISDVGTARFEDSLAAVSGSLLQCHQITAFSFSADKVPCRLGLFAQERDNEVKRAAKRYETIHWKQDPSNFFLRDREASAKSFAVLLSRQDIKDESFLDDCYVEPDVGHRLSLISEFNGHPVKLSFHRRECLGHFDQLAIKSALNHARSLISLVLKHVDITSRFQSHESEREIFEKVLETRYPELTNRERAVCGLIAIGMSSEAIALTLGISINTVLTFRRRAYSRLNISTQNELLRILYRACAQW
ncbi:helix-turn-helix transcriptional regulator [Pseudogemmobacter sonorensis]|uniref:helix-turn-helix transcriptional regulator n=1 Tax=Pseudogemmobacter sonorensis TaxID=2989681 RepID=UPI0036CD5BC6